MASTRKSFFGAASMRASISNDGEGTREGRLPPVAGSLTFNDLTFVQQPAPKLAVERGAWERHHQRRGFRSFLTSNLRSASITPNSGMRRAWRLSKNSF